MRSMSSLPERVVVSGRKTPTEPTSRVSASSNPSATADLPVKSFR